MEARGAPISYLVLEKGTPVYSADGRELGKVKRVLADTEVDIFDGLIVDTPDGDRFVDAPNVDEIHERAVILKLSAADARHMPEPTPSPAYMEPTPDDIAGDTTEDTIAFALRRAWERISGNY
jgi:sporulation protein YlmC with PRC-barrel domain